MEFYKINVNRFWVNMKKKIMTKYAGGKLMKKWRVFKEEKENCSIKQKKNKKEIRVRNEKIPNNYRRND